MLCGNYGSDNLWKIKVYFLSQILIEKKYIVNIGAIFPIFKQFPA